MNSFLQCSTFYNLLTIGWMTLVSSFESYIYYVLASLVIKSSLNFLVNATQQNILVSKVLMCYLRMSTFPFILTWAPVMPCIFIWFSSYLRCINDDSFTNGTWDPESIRVAPSPSFNCGLTVWQLNSQNVSSVSLGCWVRQTHVPNQVWTCSNLRLHEPQTKCCIILLII
jgi:hypothetical protein